MLSIIIPLVIIIALIAANVRIVPQAQTYVIEFLGKYKATWNAGLHVKIPFLERIVKKISLKEQVLDFPPQPVITKDNVTMQIDSVVFCKVIDPKLYTYGVESPITGLQNLSATTLRNIIGDMELDQTLTSRDEINRRMEAILDEATDPWGIRVTRVEIRNINPPKEIEEAASIDGANTLQILTRVLIPVLLPGIGSTAILGFITSWNEYLFSGILAFKKSITATVGTSFFITSYAVEWGNMAAAITLSTIPTALFIFIAQKSLVKGMTAGSVKG